MTYEVINKKNGKLYILDEDELANLKRLRIIDRYKITEMKPIRAMISPLQPEVVKKKPPLKK